MSNDPPDIDAVLVHSSAGGLCNRLIALACFAARAGAWSVPLSVWWSTDWACPGLPEEGLDRDSLYWQPVNEREWVRRVRAAANPAVYAHALCTATAGQYAAAGFFESGAAARAAVAAGLRRLRPAAGVDARLRTLPAGLTGLHVRRTDLAGDSNAVRDVRLLARLDREAADGNGPWLLACDDPATVTRLRDRYGARVVHTGAVFRGRETRLTGTADAVLDLFALSRCRHVLGTSGSTFGEAAAAIGGTTLEML